MTAETREAITVPHAAAIAQVTIPRMQQLLRAGKVEGWREGRQWKTTRQAVESYLQNRRSRSSARSASTACEPDIEGHVARTD